MQETVLGYVRQGVLLNRKLSSTRGNRMVASRNDSTRTAQWRPAEIMLIRCLLLTSA